MKPHDAQLTTIAPRDRGRALQKRRERIDLNADFALEVEGKFIRPESNLFNYRRHYNPSLRLKTPSRLLLGIQSTAQADFSDTHGIIPSGTHQ